MNEALRNAPAATRPAGNSTGGSDNAPSLVPYREAAQAVVAALGSDARAA